MIKKTVAAIVAASFLAGCSTDPYTGEQKVSNARAVLPSARWLAQGSACSPVATIAATRCSAPASALWPAAPSA